MPGSEVVVPHYMCARSQGVLNRSVYSRVPLGVQTTGTGAHLCLAALVRDAFAGKT
jgi:hypothetical protein